MSSPDPLPRIPIDLRQHKLAIGIPWVIIIFCGGVSPIVGYLCVHYLSNEDTTVALSPFLALFGASTIYNLVTRTYALVRKDSTCRPVGATSRWGGDVFEWNLLGGFIGITVLIAISIAKKLVRVASLPLAVILLYACTEILLGVLAHMAGVRAPFRISSTAKGERVRSGVLAIAEDIVAVDGKQGTELRRLLIARYDASPPIQKLCRNLDLMWGIGGLCIAGAVAGIAFGVSNSSIGFAIGWGLPWVFAAVWTLITIAMVKGALREEQRYFAAAKPRA